EASGKIETLLEQLRVRQLSIEQLETYDRQRTAVEKLRTLTEAQAQAAMQTQLTNARVQVQIAESQGEADLARARKQADQTGGNGDQAGASGSAAGMLGLVLNLLVAERSGFQPVDVAEMTGLKDLGERLTREAMESLRQGSLGTPPVAGQSDGAAGPG